MRALEEYLRSLYYDRSSGEAVRETSYYGALQNLLNAAGDDLRPKVRAIINIRNRGAGIPDGGLFTQQQYDRGIGEDAMSSGQLPERGAVEVKGVEEEVTDVARDEQVGRYLERYGQVLVTNYRDFLFVGRGPSGELVELDSYTLAPTNEAFWELASRPRQTAAEQGERFMDFLRRVMLHGASLERPEDLARFLASFARDALMDLEAKSSEELPALERVRSALEQALGLRFEEDRGEHFFRSTLVQTLFYGVFSAWVLWSKRTPTDAPAEEQFDWRLAAYIMNVPVIRALFEQLTMRRTMEALGLEHILDRAGGALNRVERRRFFERFDEEGAVQYFYEPFLEAFDPELRRQLGVWYTPPEIVRYMVERVDAVLREELEVEDGLADEMVYVLDPACGTGTYLVEVLGRIERTLKERGEEALLGSDLKKAATRRVFGFEILPAPFVVAHLQLGLLLQNLGAPLSEDEERAGVFLTNSLTGWEPPEGPKQNLRFEEMEEERDAAEEVKQRKPILVILGNPPYNAFAGTSSEEEGGLVEPYKEGLRDEWGIGKFNLDDLYVRFFRVAERKIAEETGKGIVCYISNHSWVSDPSFVVMRQKLMGSFDKFWIENMHRNRRISERAPDGSTSETIFAVPGFSPGIQQGVAISLWFKREGGGDETPTILFRDDLNAARAAERRQQLLKSLEDPKTEEHYEAAEPSVPNRLSFRPSDVGVDFLSWPLLSELCKLDPPNGLMEKRGGALIDIENDALEERMRRYFDRSLGWDDLKARDEQVTKDRARYNAMRTRDRVLNVETYDPDRLRRYVFRPFDTRWCYYSEIRPLWNENRPTLWAQQWNGNAFLISRKFADKDPEGPPFYFARTLVDDHLLAPDANCFPLRLREDFMGDAQSDDAPTSANLSDDARRYLSSIGFEDPDADTETAGMIWMHALAVGFSPAYLQENQDGVRQDWPRVPLPDSSGRLQASAELGTRVASLLDTENAVRGVDSGTLRQELSRLATISSVGDSPLDPDAGDLALTVGWGRVDRRGRVSASTGRPVPREYTREERAAIEEGALDLRLSAEEAFNRLGTTTFDLYMNSKAFWRNVPAEVFDYHIGGYPVIRRWLSYREEHILDRPLGDGEARELAAIIRRIAAFLLLEPLLDENYEAVKASCYPWTTDH